MEEIEKFGFRMAKKVWDRVFGHTYTVESMDYVRKRKGTKYETRHNGSDEWSCNCPSWKFKSGVQIVKDLKTGKRHERTCKHIRFCMGKEGIKYKRIWK